MSGRIEIKTGQIKGSITVNGQTTEFERGPSEKTIEVPDVTPVDRVLEALAKKPFGMRLGAIAVAAGVETKVCSQSLHALRQLGRVRADAAAKVWYLTGKELAARGINVIRRAK